MQTLFALLHVVGAVFIVGPVAVLPMAALRSLRTGHTARAASSARGIRLLGYLSLIVFVTGFGLVGLADPRYGLSVTTPWVLVSTVLYVIAIALTLFVVVPALAGAGYAVAGSAAARSAYSRTAASSGIATLLLVAVVVLMVLKP